MGLSPRPETDARRTAKRCRNKVVCEINPLVSNATANMGHMLDGIHSQVLVICEDEEKVGPGPRAGLGKGREPSKSNKTAQLHDAFSKEAALGSAACN